MREARLNFRVPPKGVLRRSRPRHVRSLSGQDVRSLVGKGTALANGTTQAVVRLTASSLAIEALPIQGIATSSDSVSVQLLTPEYSALVQLLSEVNRRLPEYFEPGAFLTTERLYDPDSTSAPLFVVVHTRMEPAAALAALERFDQEWWLDQAGMTAGLIEVSIAYEA